MRLRQLRFLVAVYEEGSFTAAAQRMHATQSGISAQIKQLEESLRTVLFEREANGVTPTPSGKLAYQRAILILRETSAMASDIDALQQRLTGAVSAGLMPTTTRSVIAPVLEKFAIHYPDVDIKIEEAYSAHLCEGVKAGRLDFALVPPSDATVGLRSTHLATDIEVYVTRPDVQMPHLSGVDLSRLGPLKLILPGGQNARRARIDEQIKTHNLPIKKVMELDAMMATLDLVARSDWSTILPGCLVMNDVAGSERSLHPIIKPGMSLEYVLIEQASGSLSPAAQLLREELRTELVAVCQRSNALFSVTDDPDPTSADPTSADPSTASD